jgi:Tfp pilus assembly protein PilN
VRPVNLIPPEDRHGGTPVRTGPIAYLLVGALAIALAAVTMVVLANNKIGDRKAEIVQLNQQVAAVSAQADQLQPFIQFSDTERQRTDTVRALANSRFDWERVMRELALVLPGDISLTDLTATAPNAATADASGTATGAPTVPTLELTGCAQGHDGVAGFLSALRDIDGVTSVDLQSSERASADEISGSSSTSTTDCRTNLSISKFTLTVAFGAAPAAQGATAAPATAAPAAAAPASTASSSPAVPASSTTPGTGG